MKRQAVVTRRVAVVHHSETLRHCLRAVIVGDVMVGSRTVVQAFIDAQRSGPLQRAAAPSLTPRERAVLAHLATGLSRGAI